MDSKVHHQDCTPKCCSKKHADYLLSAITKGKEHEDQVLSFLTSCHNVAVNKDSNGRTALQVAASFGCTKIMKWLLSLKDTHIIHIKDSESGYTPLHRAFYFGQLQAARCLLNHQASLFQIDNDYLTCMDHLIHDRLPIKPSNQLLEVCVWGSNSNYSLGLGNQQSPSTPELLEFFRKDKISMKQVAMSKFHSVFVSHAGQAYSCGHGLGGRLGKNSELPTLTPERLAIFDSEPCKFAAVGIDHTIFLTEEGKVWTCGMNQYHQLGHSPAPSKELAPKCISTFSGKNKSILIQGVCASRYHSVFWSSDSLYTCGLNAGALGHIKGDKTIILPKKVTSLSAPDLKITHVAASDGATAIATKKGDVYILHEYQCRKIASKQFELEKIVMIGGQLDSTILEEEKLRAVTLQVILLTTSGKLFLWTQTNPILTRCFFRLGRPLVIRDIALNSASMFLISQESEVFTGTVIQKEKNKTNKVIPDQSDKVRRTNSWIEFAKREQSYQIKVQRVPFIYNAVSIACDPQGRNFSVIQVSPSTKLLDKIHMIPSQFQEDMKQLLDDATPQDPVHDITFVVNKRIFPAHRFILASTAPDFYKKFCSDSEGEILIEEIEEEVFELILHFIYSGNCEIAPSTITEEESSSWKSSASNFYRTLQTWATKLGIDSLTNLLTKTRSNSIPDRLSTNLKPFSRGFLKELCDVKIRSDDGKEFEAHRVILAARLDYFRSMFQCGWIETTKMDVVNLPIHSSVLDILLDYIYRDRTPKIDKTDDISLIGNVLVVADQLLIPRLVSICEFLLIGLMSLKNVGQMLDFSSIYNAGQLKRSCMQFICFNLPAVVEMRIWDCLSEEVMEELTSFYKEKHPRMIYRFMGPSSEAPSDEILDEYTSSLDQLFTFDSPTNKANNKVRSKVRRKSGQTQRVSETKERLSSVSSTQSIEDDWSPPVTDPIISKPINIQWSKVGKVKKSGKKINNTEKGVDELIGSPLKDLQLSASPVTKKQVVREDDPVTPSKPNLTLFELASVSKTITSSSSSSKKFPKLSQKQRKSQGSSNSKDPAEVTESDPGISPPLPVEQVKSPWMRKSSQPEETKCVPDNISFPVLAHQGIPEVTATASSSMRSIIATEKLQVRNSAKTRSKPLRLTLIEDQAIADLHQFYQTDVVDDENITVVRLVPDEFALPVWSQKSRKF